MMIFSEPIEFRFASRFRQFLFLNPYRTAECDAELTALQSIRLPSDRDRKKQSPIDSDRPEIVELVQRIDSLLAVLRRRLDQGVRPKCDEEATLLQTLILGATHYRHFENRVPLKEAGDGSRKVNSYRAFEREILSWNQIPFPWNTFLSQPAHMFAVYFQLRRCYDLINELIQGDSRPITKLRAEVWHSLFPHELELYGTLLFDRMHDVTTLILGPSGTGKDNVAQAIGLSRYIPFDSRSMKFTEPLAGAFHSINLSAMPIDLIESELFGHSAGSFTGATQDRAGWFERCENGHSVFLDEIGELDPSIQVKLLRVLQNREFYRVGETKPRRFEGKVIAATNRVLPEEIESGRFRQDLFYRLCSDLLVTPSLREQLDDSPHELPRLVKIVAARCLGARATEEHVEWLSRLSVEWIEKSPSLGVNYEWPGNFRELEQCVRNVLVRGRYEPFHLDTTGSRSKTSQTASKERLPGGSSPLETLLERIERTELSYDELLDEYCSLVFARSAHLSAAARRLKKHRATVQSRIKSDLVAKYKPT